jgi:predicted nucleotidyltransferase component of viral defense system
MSAEMISRAEILERSNGIILPPGVVERDYMLGWVLCGIYAHPQLKGHWIFKGGVCLKNDFFETYRFSENLDFTLRERDHVDADFLREVFAEISVALYEEAGLEFPADQMKFDVYEDSRGNPSSQGQLYYRSQFQTGNISPSLRLDLTTDELLTEGTVTRKVLHPYSDEPAGGIHVVCYSYE